MTRLNVVIEAPRWRDRVEGRPDQARRSRLAALLRDMASAVEQGRTEAVFERPDLTGTFELELPSRTSSEPAAA